MSEARIVALFPGSFDPPTLGHLDVITRASALFDEVVVAVGAASGKTPLFSAEERVRLIREACQHLPNVRVESYDGLTVDCARRVGATVMVRGVRSGADFDYEVRMAFMNRELAPELDTVFLPTSPALSHISSTLAKEIARHGGDVSRLVPKAALEPLKKRVKGS